METLPLSIENLLKQAEIKLKDNPKLLNMFKKCYVNTLQTTTKLLDDGSTFVFTGDIPAMWLRDSSAQVRHYIPLTKNDSALQRIIEGLVKTQVRYILIDSYANAFNLENNNNCYTEDKTEFQNPWAWERKYEVDSLCYPIQIAYLYWKASEKTSHFNEDFKKVCNTIIDQFKLEQKHEENSKYFFIRKNCPPSDTLKNNGKGMPVNYTGMTWSGFRPSDDACTFGYLIPSNMFAVVILGYIQEIAEKIYNDLELKEKAKILQDEIDYGIKTYGIYRHPVYGPMYAYETDGYGNYNLMDDANVPSLLSIPYLGYCDYNDEIYQNTRKFILSSNNPYFYSGKCAEGIGSPHTPEGYIWHIALCMQALTSKDSCETQKLVSMLENTDASTGFMHEGFNPNCPEEFTREWFAWANSIFGELIAKLMEEGHI